MCEEFLKKIIEFAKQEVKEKEINVLKKYYVPDLNTEGCKVLFILESPDKTEIDAKGKARLPALGQTGKNLSKVLGYDCKEPLSLLIKDGEKTNIVKYGIMEISNLPLQDIYSTKDKSSVAQIISQLCIIKKCYELKKGSSYNLAEHKNLLSSLIRNNLVVNCVFCDFKKRIENVFDEKLIIPMGVIAQTFFEEAFNVQTSLYKQTSTKNVVYCYSHHPIADNFKIKSNQKKLKNEIDIFLQGN